MNRVASKPSAVPHETAELVYAEQVRILYRHAPATVIVNAIITLAAAILVWGMVSPQKLLFWLALVFAAVVVRILLWWGYRRARPAASQAAKWGRRYTFGMLFSGAGWGSASVLLFSPDALLQQLGVAVIVIGLAAGVASSAASYVTVVYAFVLSSMVPFAFVFATQGTLFHGVFAAMTVICILGMMKFARVNYQMLSEAIALRFEVAVQRDAAERADAAKSRFLAAASHDLRQPLHTLSLYSAALKLQAPRGATGEIAGHIDKALAALSVLVNSLLDISKLDAGAVDPEPRRVGMQALIERIAADYRPLARERGLEFHVAAADVHVETDPVLLERLVRNLVDNAFKYTVAGSITLTADSDEHRVGISVRDTGAGIPTDERERIFEEFYQIDNPERDRSEGLGLGLAIVRRIARLLGLEVELESEPGRGSTFAVMVPRAPGRIAARPVAVAPVVQKSHTLEGVRVLVIDDEPDVRNAMQTLLEHLSCRVVVCDGYAEAERLLDEHALEVDLIVADFRLRRHENGIDTVRRLRARLGEVPALLVSGDTAPERLREAQASGLPLLHKPVPADKLMETMLALLRR